MSMRAKHLLSLCKKNLIAAILVVFIPCSITYAHSETMIDPTLEQLIKKVVKKYPHNLRYARIYMRFNYSHIQKLQKSLDRCIKQKRQTKGCDRKFTRRYGQDNNGPTKAIQIKNSVITITPNTKVEPFSFLSESDTIIVTPIYKEGKITWVYSGGLFEPRKKVKVDILITCPLPSALPSKIIDGKRLFIKTWWLISASATGKPIADIMNKDLEFVGATIQGLRKGKVACNYKIKTNTRPYYVTLYSLENPIKISNQGSWSSETPGICNSYNVKDCPFHLTERFLKETREF